MSSKLRRFNDAGIERFRNYLEGLRKDGTLAPPADLLTSAETSEAVAGNASIERPGFKSKNELAAYVDHILSPLHLPNLAKDVGLWTWLALFWFDDVCPLIDGKRHGLKDPHYIFEPSNWQRRYRHLVATPYEILQLMPDHNAIYLNGPVSIHGDLIEQTLSRLDEIRYKAFREVVSLLYYDEERGQKTGQFYKRGTLSRTRKGNLPIRLQTRVKQLSLTYDVAAMSGSQLIDYLGTEFDGWREKDDDE